MNEGQLKVFAGRKGTGKTSLCMKEFSPIKSGIVYDFQNHWGELTYYNEGEKITEPGCRLIRNPAEIKVGEKLRVSPENFNIHNFTAMIKHFKGFTFVFEEATGLFPDGRISQELIQETLSCRHTGNNFYFVFHSLHRVPPQLIEFINELYLFQTYDNEVAIKKKYSKIFDQWRKIQVMGESNPYYYEKIIPPIS